MNSLKLARAVLDVTKEHNANCETGEEISMSHMELIVDITSRLDESSFERKALSFAAFVGLPLTMVIITVAYFVANT